VIRLCLHFGVSPRFIPAGEPQFNGSVENFNGWFQEPLFPRRFRRPGDPRRELARLQEAVNTQHVHPRLGSRTPAQHRRGLRLRKLPSSFVVPTGRQKLAAGRVTFIRRVSAAGTVTALSQSFRVGKKHKGLYLRLVLDTGRGYLTAYSGLRPDGIRGLRFRQGWIINPPLPPLRKGGRTEGGSPCFRPPLTKGGRGGSSELALACATRS
jgi:hypothetical protein